MKIDLTKKQYKSLVTLVYLGDWIINSHKTKPEKKVEDVRRHINGFAQEGGLGDWIEYDPELQGYYETRTMDEEMNQYIDEYDNYTFWEELIHRLARRDFIRQYGVERIKEMNIEERIDKEYSFESKYAEEFEKNGIDNILIER